MKKPTRRADRPAMAAASAELPPTPKLEHAPMSDIIDALAAGRVTATAASPSDHHLVPFKPLVGKL